MHQQETIEPVYREVQRLRSPLVWVLMTIVTVVLWYLVISEVFAFDSDAGETMPLVALLVLWLIGGVVLPVVFIFGHLRTEVRTDGVFLRFWPFHLSDRRIAYTDITLCEARDYRPIREYGGWGIKCGKGGWSYTMSGSRGVQLEMKDGKRLLIGSQRADELAGKIRARLLQTVP